MSDLDTSNFSFSKSAKYRIKVLGELSLEYSERLGGMKIKVQEKLNMKPITVLEGNLRDQAALSGILNTLYQFHLTVLSVKRISD